MLLLTNNTGQEAGGQQKSMVIRDVCPWCQSSKYKKNGHTHNGKQNHQCQDCGRQFVQCFEQSLISDNQRALIERLLLERISLRGICRAVDIGLKWLLERFPTRCSGPISVFVGGQTLPMYMCPTSE
jgi:transposase-like protein